MKIEYAVSRGEGTLLDYGVAAYVQADKFGIEIPEERPTFKVKLWDAECTVISRPCPDDCETGK